MFTSAECCKMITAEGHRTITSVNDHIEGRQYVEEALERVVMLIGEAAYPMPHDKLQASPP
jgi:hypothetical protein